MTNREEQFIKETDTIKSRLIILSQQPDITLNNRLEISALWMEFSELWKIANREDFAKQQRIQEQYKKLVKVFKKFENKIRIFKTLPDY